MQFPENQYPEHEKPTDLFGYSVGFSYLSTMNKDEIIELLKEQNSHYKALVDSLLAQVKELTEKIASLEEALLRKNESLGKQQRIAKGLAKLVSNKSERQDVHSDVPADEEERKRLEEERAIQRKARKNNGAKRDPHHELEIMEHDVYPDDPDFDMDKARLLTENMRTCVRYEYLPMRFIKHVYHIRTYVQEGRMFEGKTPKAAFFNSNYDASFIAGLMELRYIHSMPVERIVNYFESHGFNLKKPTAHKLLEKASGLFGNLYKCIRKSVKQDGYISADETYYRILLGQGKGSKKGYLWVVVGMESGLVYVLYEDGSRAEAVILDELKDYTGILQSDAYSAYRKLQSDAYPGIVRIACLQHVKRKFIDCGKEPEAEEMVSLINELYRKEHEHRIGMDGWTEEKNEGYRRKYAPKILEKIDRLLKKIESLPGLLPKSNLYEAATYMRNEWEAIKEIFSYGNTNLDNNTVERLNRYFSISRRNSLFFGSHKGAERAAILYTLALSCRMNKVDLFEYLTDIIDRTAEWQPNTPLQKYRDLLPDKWKRG